MFVLAGAVASLFHNSIYFTGIWYCLIPTVVIFHFAYFWGCGSTFRDRLAAALFCWVFTVFEGMAAWGSLVRPPDGFDIIKKA
jgi:hypothetical protein